MQSTGSSTFQLHGDGAVLDACYTLSGDKVATCSSKGLIQVWSCTTSEAEWDLLHSEELSDQPRLVSWAHPEHGLVLAVATQSGTVHVLQGPAPASRGSNTNQQLLLQQQQQQRATDGWCVTGKLACGDGQVSALAFAPRQSGLVLAVACTRSAAAAAAVAGSNSRVLLYEAAGVASHSLQWTLTGQIKLPSGAGTCRCICWREAAVGLPPLLVLGHDNGGSIWAYYQSSMNWQEVCSLSAPAGGQQSALLALHWAPALGRPHELLAASFGSTAVIYKVSSAAAAQQAGGSSTELGPLTASVVAQLRHPAGVWKLEFNTMGNMLACSLDGRPEVWFWMPSMDGEWRSVSKIKGQQQQQHEQQEEEDGVGNEQLD